jgi:hypothetical protein
MEQKFEGKPPSRGTGMRSCRAPITPFGGLVMTVQLLIRSPVFLSVHSSHNPAMHVPTIFHRHGIEKAISPDEKAAWLKIAKEWERMAVAANRNPGAF